MALGAGSVTLKDLTNAYAMIVNGGKELNPIVIQSVYDKRGKLIINNEKKICLDCIQISEELEYKIPQIQLNKKEILDSAIAYQITSMLEGVIKRGTGSGSYHAGTRPTARRRRPDGPPTPATRPGARRGTRTAYRRRSRPGRAPYG